MRYLHTHRGVSLTELMIALVVSSAVVASMYGAFAQQQQISTRQEQLTEARQNVRLTVDAMLQEIRAAGFDPGGLAGAGIEEADGVHIRFTRDLNCNGTLASSDTVNPAKGVPDAPPGRATSDEDIAYRFDAETQELGRLVHVEGTPTGGLQPMASNILNLNFCYFLTTNPAGPCIPNPAPAAINNIRAVHITLTARASAPDPHYTDPDPTQNPAYKHYRKATLGSLVHLRNLGVQRGGRAIDLDDPCPLPRQ